MLILALDTTTRGGSVCVARDDEVLAVVVGDVSRTHGERLPAEIERGLEHAGVVTAEIDLLAVASGPGAFTGLRIGLATIQGLAMVLAKPVVGVSALDALAHSAWEAQEISADASVETWMDAQRGEVFAATYGKAAAPAAFPWRQLDGPVAAEPEMLLALRRQLPRRPAWFIGDGAKKHRASIEAAGDDQWRVLPLPETLAPAVARLARDLAARGAAGPPHALQPLYVRRPDAELDRARRAQP